MPKKHKNMRPHRKAIRQLRRVFDKEMYGAPEETSVIDMSSLAFEVLRLAIIDFYELPRSKSTEKIDNGIDAMCFLQGEMHVIQLCDVDPEYVRLVLKQSGINIYKIANVIHTNEKGLYLCAHKLSDNNYSFRWHHSKEYATRFATASSWRQMKWWRNEPPQITNNILELEDD